MANSNIDITRSLGPWYEGQEEVIPADTIIRSPLITTWTILLLPLLWKMYIRRACIMEIIPHTCLTNHRASCGRERQSAMAISEFLIHKTCVIDVVWRERIDSMSGVLRHTTYCAARAKGNLFMIYNFKAYCVLHIVIGFFRR